MKYLYLFIILLLCSHALFGQRVGLVLSGGGAKGIAHVGLLQALEDHEIPIDYITGTSIGAIVGSLYAMGYSPQEMMKTFASDEFKRWQTGEVEKNRLLYYKQNDPTPDFINFKINFKDSAKIKTYFLPTSLVNPVQMNIVFIRLYAQATGYCNGNFDDLFVPFRSVSSDVYNKKAVIAKSGDLGNAVRASMSFPFVFKPLKIDGVLLYDGGIFDNFPVTTMINDFNPDFIIGSALVNNPNPDIKDVYTQIETMIMNKSDYSVPSDKGIMIQFDLSNVSLMDFGRMDETYRIGYEMGLKYIDQIKEKVSRRTSIDALTIRRAIFRNSLPKLTFGNIEVEEENNNAAVEEYVKRFFDNPQNKEVSVDNLEEIYFRILSDSKISEIIPLATFNPSTKKFDLHLQVKKDDNLNVGFGGMVSSMSYNQAYLGISYQSIYKYLSDYHLDTYVGTNYNSIGLTTRITIPTRLPFYIKGQAMYNTNKFYEGERLFYQEDLQSYYYHTELYFRLKFGFPVNKTSRMELSAAFGEMNDKYAQSRMSTEFDKSKYQLFSTSATYEKNTLNNNMYPDKGSQLKAQAQYLIGNESYLGRSNNISLSNRPIRWVQVSLRGTRYFAFSPNFVLGTMFQALYAAKPLFQNYTSTVIQAPEFTPTPHSKVIFNEAFRAHEFVAGGLLPIFKFKNEFQIRGEVYAFLPYRRIMRNPDFTPRYSDPLSIIQGMSEISLVYNLPIGSIALYTNYYTSPKNNFNFGINIGIQLHNPKFID